MIVLPNYLVEKLIQIELGVHYGELPPPGRKPFIVIAKDSPVILSAPHGAITFRDNGREIWHEEDEYTAGMAILLAQICDTSLIATTWRTEESDPNEHPFGKSPYKQVLKQIVEKSHAKWVIDLHGASIFSEFLADEQWVDLGLGKRQEYLPKEVSQKLILSIEQYLGKGVTDRKGKQGFNASDPNRIAAFARTMPSVSSVQIEMKPNVRIPQRRVDTSRFTKPQVEGGGSYSAPAQGVIGMMQALVDFVEFLKEQKE